jgi:hypothetical protein
MWRDPLDGDFHFGLQTSAGRSRLALPDQTPPSIHSAPWAAGRRTSRTGRTAERRMCCQFSVQSGRVIPMKRSPSRAPPLRTRMSRNECVDLTISNYNPHAYLHDLEREVSLFSRRIEISRFFKTLYLPSLTILEYSYKLLNIISQIRSLSRSCDKS